MCVPPTGVACLESYRSATNTSTGICSVLYHYNNSIYWMQVRMAFGQFSDSGLGPESEDRPKVSLTSILAICSISTLVSGTDAHSMILNIVTLTLKQNVRILCTLVHNDAGAQCTR
eukprot:gene17314-biopygen555